MMLFPVKDARMPVINPIAGNDVNISVQFYEVHTRYNVSVCKVGVLTKILHNVKFKCKQSRTFNMHRTVHWTKRCQNMYGTVLVCQSVYSTSRVVVYTIYENVEYSVLYTYYIYIYSIYIDTSYITIHIRWSIDDIRYIYEKYTNIR